MGFSGPISPRQHPQEAWQGVRRRSESQKDPPETTMYVGPDARHGGYDGIDASYLHVAVVEVTAISSDQGHRMPAAFARPLEDRTHTAEPPLTVNPLFATSKRQ